jgi:HEAT repeat protein
MSPLMLIWWTALVLAAGAFGWMLWLLGARQFKVAFEADRERQLAHLKTCLVRILGGDASAAADIAAWKGHARVLAEALLEVMSLVKGRDRQRLAEALADTDVDRILARRVGRPGKAGRLAAIEALGLFPPYPGRNVLTRATADPDPDVRIAAWRAIRECGGEIRLRDLLDNRGFNAAQPPLTYVELFRRLAADQPEETAALLAEGRLSPQLELHAVEALGESRAATVIRPLGEIAALASGPLKAAALKALGQFAYCAAEPTIAQAMSDPDWRVRAEAASAAARCKLFSQLDRTAALLADPNWAVRFRAAEALVLLGKGGAARLREAAAGAEPRARRAASLVLSEHGLA